MKRYIGTFKDINEKDIHIEIVPTDDYTDTVELKFVGDSPIIIEQESDGIFSAIKSKSCTITLFSDEIYWDLYTPKSTGYYVHVFNDELSLFDGYLTPCIYSQDYAYKSQIELEAVDYLATIKTIDYKSEDRQIITVDSLLNKIFGNIPNFNSYFSRTDIDFTKYYIQESNFFDDDDEPMNCQEILEELFNYLGLSATMYNGDVIIYDCDSITKELLLDKDNYGAGVPSIELDEVYNKINIGCDLYEIEDVIDDVIDKDYKTVENELKKDTGTQLYSDYYFSWREHNHHTTDKNRYTMLVKPYIFNENSRWKTYNRRLNDCVLEEYNTDNRVSRDCSILTSDGNKLFVPYYMGAYPIKVYSFSKEEGMANKTSIQWNDYILFPALDWNARTHGRERGTYEALTFTSDEDLAYSIDGGTGYLVFNGDLYTNSEHSIHGVDTDVIWCEINGNKVALPLPVDNFGLSFLNTEWMRRNKDSQYYNQGWGAIEARLRIGNKYWNGISWQTRSTTFWIPYHDDDVNGDDETLNYLTWLKVAANPNVPKISVGEDGYAIPITAADKLHGKLEFTLFTPTQWAENKNSRCINNFFIKNLSFKYKYQDSQHWAEDRANNNDIIYENIINEDFAKEMNELDLKINSWYVDKPISKSYFLDENYLPVVKINGEIQEVRLLEKYYNHYSRPKKILNLNYKTLDTNPMTKYYHTQTETTYILDSYEMDVKSGETKLKIIEL